MPSICEWLRGERDDWSEADAERYSDLYTTLKNRTPKSGHRDLFLFNYGGYWDAVGGMCAELRGDCAKADFLSNRLTEWHKYDPFWQQMEGALALASAISTFNSALATDYQVNASSASARRARPDARVDGTEAATEAGSAASIDEALSGLNAGRSAGVRVVSSAEELDDLFAQLSRGGEVVESSYPGKFVRLPDGSTVGLRGTSATGGPTIDIVKPGQRPIKIHISP
jgi:hypothetical protein